MTSPISNDKPLAPAYVKPDGRAGSEGTTRAAGEPAQDSPAADVETSVRARPTAEPAPRETAALDDEGARTALADLREGLLSRPVQGVSAHRQLNAEDVAALLSVPT